MGTQPLTRRVDVATGRWGPTILRWTAALLWLANVNWKVPPNFGRTGERCVALCRYVETGADFPVVPGSAWFFEHVASPNLAAFGWMTLISESILVVLLVSDRFVRTAALVGMAMSTGIGLAVANAEHEWYWSYLLMIALHLAILVTTPTARPQLARMMAVITAGYGVIVAVAHAGAGFSGDGDWVLFSQGNDLPGDWGRGTFPGSIALGLLFVVLGAAGCLAGDRLSSTEQRVVGWGLIAVSALLLVTYEPGGLIIGLGSRPGTACMFAAFGLSMAVTSRAEAAPGHAGGS
jgi:hypothetical protein